MNMQVLIVGLGSIGERHVRNLRSLGVRKIAVIRRSNRPPRTLRGDEYLTFFNIEEAIREKPDVVIVANPTSLHIPVAIKAAEIGAHLLIEIPLSASLEGINILREKVKKRSLVTLMGHNLRFHPCLHEVKKILERGHIGRPLCARSEFGEYLPECHPWEDYSIGYAARKELGGGVVLTSIHEIDYLYWLFGPIRQVMCMARKLSDLKFNVEDTAAIVMEHENGFLSEVHLDFVQRTYSRGLQIIGSEGTVRWDFLQNRVSAYRVADKSWQDILYLPRFDFNTTYIEEIKHLLRCKRGEEQSINDLDQGIHVLRVGLAALESSAKCNFVKIKHKNPGQEEKDGKVREVVQFNR
jgi:predicted dehydrogenase